MRKIKLTRREWDALTVVHDLGWEDGEQGGAGWAFIEDIAERLGISEAWAIQRMGYFRTIGLVQRQRVAKAGHRFEYALTADGWRRFDAGWEPHRREGR